MNEQLLTTLRELEAHHVEQNRLKGRPEEHSKTLRLVREAIATAPSFMQSESMRQKAGSWDAVWSLVCELHGWPIRAGESAKESVLRVIREAAAAAPALAELERAMRKFPTWPTDPLHAVAVVGEEAGELTKAVLQAVYEPHKSTPEDVRTEAIQTAAMALRFIASLDRYDYARGVQHQQGARRQQSEGDAYVGKTLADLPAATQARPTTITTSPTDWKP